MTTTTTTTAIVPFDPVFADPKRLAPGGFLAGDSDLTRDTYELDLRQFVAWCDDHQLDLFEVRPADIEAFAPELERRGRARATQFGDLGGARDPPAHLPDRPHWSVAEQTAKAHPEEFRRIH